MRCAFDRVCLPEGNIYHPKLAGFTHIYYGINKILNSVYNFIIFV